MSDAEGLLVARITIERRLFNDNEHPDQILFEAINPCTGEEPTLVETLGLLRMCEDTAIRCSMMDDE